MEKPFISLLLSMSFLFTTLLVTFLVTLFSTLSVKKAFIAVTNFVKLTGTKAILVTFFINSSVFFIFSSIYDHYQVQRLSFFDASICFFTLMFIVTFSFVLSPVLSVKLNKNLISLPAYSEFLNKEFNANVIIMVIEHNIKNAYAAGILPFFKVIVIGKPLVDQFSEIQLKGVVLHEYAHIKYNHLFKIYLVSILGVFLNVVFFFVFSFVKFDVDLGVRYAIMGGLTGYLNFQLLPGLFRKRFEFEADAFAASHVGSGNFQEALIQLDKLTEGALQRKSATHPTLSQRMERLRKNK